MATGLGHAGGDALAQSMASNQCIVMLDIGCNNIGVKELEGIMDCLDSNKKLMEISDKKARENRVRQRNEDRIRSASSDAASKKKNWKIGTSNKDWIVLLPDHKVWKMKDK